MLFLRIYDRTKIKIFFVDFVLLKEIIVIAVDGDYRFYFWKSDSVRNLKRQGLTV